MALSPDRTRDKLLQQLTEITGWSTTACVSERRFFFFKSVNDKPKWFCMHLYIFANSDMSGSLSLPLALASLVLTMLACWNAELRCLSNVGNFQIISPGRYFTTGDGRQEDVTAVFA